MYVHWHPSFWLHCIVLTEHVIKHNHKPTATPPSTVIAAADNHSLNPFASLALVPSHPPLVYALGPLPSWISVSSPQSKSMTSMPMLFYCLRFVGLPYKMGWGRRRGGGYWVIVWMGTSLTVTKLSPLRRSLKKKVKKKKSKGVKGNEEEGNSPSDGISADAEMIIRSVCLSIQCGWSWS